MENKSSIRKALELLEDEIQKSWLKDLDKVRQFEELFIILTQILESESIELYFNDNASDVEYFLKRFSRETINNILKQHFIFGENGDDVALSVILTYVKIFLKFLDRPQYVPLWDSIKEIFDCGKHYYKPQGYGNLRIDQDRRLKKQMSAESFNENHLPKDISKIPEVKEGDLIDVCVDNRKPYQMGNLNDRKIWTRGRVLKIETEYLIVKYADEYGTALIKKTSFDYALVGTMTKDYEWRISLKEGDVIDCYDRQHWFPSTVLAKKESEINGLPYVSYFIGFRLLTDSFPNWSNYTKFWPEKSLTKDSKGRATFGDVENYDETITYYSKRIMPLDSMTSGGSYLQDNFYIDDFVPFVNTKDGSKNYVIGRNSTFSFYYAKLLHHFCAVNGYEQLIDSLVSKKISTEVLHIILLIFGHSSTILHKEYLKQLAPLLQKNVSEYFNNLNQNDIRNIKKDSIDLMVKILYYYLFHTLNIKDREDFIQRLSLGFSLKMLKTSVLDKRITAVKNIVDVIRISKIDSSKKMELLKMIEDNQIFYEIFGPNSHTQLINKSKELLEIMAQEDKLTSGEMEMIWNSTKKGDLEGKLTILNILKEISKSLQSHHIQMLLANIYQNGPQDVIAEEIELIYTLIASQSRETEAESALSFFIKTLYGCQESEKEKVSLLMKKIIDITKINQKFKESVLKTCIENVEINYHSNFSFQLLQWFISDKDSELITTFSRNNYLPQIYMENFRKYNEHISGIVSQMKKSQSEIEAILEKLFIDENSIHSQCIQARLEFLNFMMIHHIWSTQSPDLIHPIDFAFEMLIVNSHSEKDKTEFYRWIKSALTGDNLNLQVHFDQFRIFNLFNEKICTDYHSLETLSKEAFDSYLKVFLDINALTNQLEYTCHAKSSSESSATYSITAHLLPDNLKGFDILWKIIFTTKNEEIVNRGINILFMLYHNAKGSDNMNYLEHLLQQCINLINDTQTEKLFVMKKSFKVLSLMIEESERKGTVRVKSHSGLLKRKVINLKIDSYIPKCPDFTVKIYGNTTMWELKEILAAKSNVGIDFLKIMIKPNYEVQDIDNGKTVIDMKLTDEDVIKISLNAIIKQIPQVALVANGEPIPQVKKIFNDWYDQYSTNGKMLPENLGKFISAVTNAREDIPPNDPRVTNFLRENAPGYDSHIPRDLFVKFFVDATVGDRANVVWENLRTMGIRNDLKRMDEPLQVYNTDKNLLPRYKLAHNENFFNTIFQLQDVDGEIAKDAFHFLCLITTNPVIYKQILTYEDTELLDSKNIYKLIYSLQIIESFLEDIEIESTNVDSFSNEEYILDSNELEVGDIKQKKIEWMQNFVVKGGFAKLVSILEDLLGIDYFTSVMNKICLQYLLKIIRIFYFSSLNKFEINKQVNKFLRKLRTTSTMAANKPEESKREQYDSESFPIDLVYGTSSEEFLNIVPVAKENPTPSLVKQSSKQFDNSQLEKIFEGELGDQIRSSLNFKSLSDKILSVLGRMCECESINDDIMISEDSFELLVGLIAFSEANDSQELEKMIIATTLFDKIAFSGLTSPNTSLREKFSNSLIRLCKVCSFFKRFDLISFLFCKTFDIILNIASFPTNSNMSEVFEFFAILFDIYFNNKNDFPLLIATSNQISPEEFLRKIAQAIQDDINKTCPCISNDIFIGYLKILSRTLEGNPTMKMLLGREFNLIEGIVTNVLFKQSNKELSALISDSEYINPDKFEDLKSNRNSNQNVRNCCYNFILAMMSGSIENFEKLFSMNLLTEVNKDGEEEKSDITTSDAFVQRSQTKKKNVFTVNLNDFYSKSYQSNQPKVEGHVGIRNLRCICYMNSVMQQFFMVPTFRHAILQISDGIAPSIGNFNIDDNVFHQVQRMFSYLELSNRSDYNPQGFCYSFKDYDNNPTDVSVQQDSNEFLSRFIEKIENSIKSTPWKYLIDSVFKGRLCSQLICEQGCNTSRNRYEEFYALSLEVKNMKTIYDSLEKYISHEKIDDYMCETCNRKVQITKRNVLADLPNVLIVHFQRLYYDYETDRNEKINSKLEFPKVLNLKNYTMEELARKSAAKRAKSGDVSDTSSLENDEIYFKPDEYYEYHLVGVNVHFGIADAGHYFSYINTIRDGSGSVMHYDPNNETHTMSWLTFNDSQISKFNVSKLEEECFGGRSSDDKGENMFGFRGNNDNVQSAYMLIYERKIKSPLKIVVQNDSTANDQNYEIISYKSDESLSIKKQYNLLRYYNTPKYEEMSHKLFNSIIFYDNEKNEHYRFKPFFEVDNLIPKQYFIDIIEDNTLLQRHQNISDEQFALFFEEIINVFSDTITQIKESSDDVQSMNNKIISTFMNFIFVLLSKKDKQKILKTAKAKFVNMLDCSKLLGPVCEYYAKNIKLIQECLVNDNVFIAQVHCELLIEVISKAYTLNPEEFLKETLHKASGNDIVQNVLFVIDSLFSLFPKVPNNLVQKILHVFIFFRQLCNLNDDILDYLLKKDFLCVFITFLIGKDSPFYQDTLTSKDDTWDLSRPMILSVEPIIDIIMQITQRSQEVRQAEDLLKTVAGIQISNAKKPVELSDRDKLCLKSPGFIKFVFKNCPKIFQEFALYLCFSDVQFSIQCCKELVRFTKDIIACYDVTDLNAVLTTILPLLRWKDEYQLIRMEILIGYPQLIMDDPNPRYNMPFFGFHKMIDFSGKVFEIKSLYQGRGICPFLRKIYNFDDKDQQAELFLILLMQCKKNHMLLKYLRHYPSEEPYYDNFIKFGDYMINHSCKSFEFAPSFQDTVGMLDTVLPNVMNNSELIPNFNGFTGKYLHYDIKREEIRIVERTEDVLILRCDYYTNTIEYSKGLDFSRSKSHFSGSRQKDDLMKPAEKDTEENNITSNDKMIVFTMEEKCFNEREWIKQNMENLLAGKIIVVQNEKKVPHFSFNVIRYIVYNIQARNYEVSFTISRSQVNFPLNEFIPIGTITNSVLAYSNTNALVITKINTDAKWSFEKDDGTLDLTFANLKIETQNVNELNNKVEYRGTSDDRFPLSNVQDFENYEDDEDIS